MANTYANLKELINESVHVTSGMIAVYPQFQTEEVLDSSWTPKFNGCYATNNSTVAFVNENELFVTPITRAAMKVLNEADFSRGFFYVPFSNWDYPKAEEKKWRRLQEKANEDREDEFIENCAKYCDMHHIGSIDEDILKNCFIMPATGVPVKHLHFENVYYPAITSRYLGCTETERLGTYCANNGKVVFVYRDGKTYVTKGYRVIEALREAGYKEKGIFVPFSNGETIMDPYLANKWEQIKK